MHSFSFIFIACISLLCFVKTSSAATFNEQTILIMGDSLSAAYNIEIQSSWPVLLQNKFNKLNAKVNIVNASISGETTFGGKNRIKTLLQRHKPNITIIELGGNDGLRGLNLSISKQNILTMIKHAKNSPSKVLLIGVRLPPNLGRRYNEKFQSMYQTIANAEQVDYLPKFLENIAGRKELMQKDGIHPTAKAQPILQDKVFKALLTMQ